MLTTISNLNNCFVLIATHYFANSKRNVEIILCLFTYSILGNLHDDRDEMTITSTMARNSYKVLTAALKVAALNQTTKAIVQRAVKEASTQVKSRKTRKMVNFMHRSYKNCQFCLLGVCLNSEKQMHNFACDGNSKMINARRCQQLRLSNVNRLKVITS